MRASHNTLQKTITMAVMSFATVQSVKSGFLIASSYHGKVDTLRHLLALARTAATDSGSTTQLPGLILCNPLVLHEQWYTHFRHLLTSPLCHFHLTTGPLARVVITNNGQVRHRPRKHQTVCPQDESSCQVHPFSRLDD
jgi:hypothetical protein